MPPLRLSYTFKNIAFDRLFRAFVQKRIRDNAEHYRVGAVRVREGGITEEDFLMPYDLGVVVGTLLSAVGKKVTAHETVVMDRRGRSLTVSVTIDVGARASSHIDITYSATGTRDGADANIEASGTARFRGFPSILKASIYGYFESRFRQENDILAALALRPGAHS